jgi:hypothetical protein
LLTVAAGRTICPGCQQVLTDVGIQVISSTTGQIYGIQ